MLRLLADEIFNGDIVRGVRLRGPESTSCAFRMSASAGWRIPPSSRGRRRPVRVGINEILLLDDGSEQAEWGNLIVHLPL